MPPVLPTREARKGANPYVGPGPFTQEDAYRFFGRSREVGELFSLVAAHRTVLLYAQSGAGKTSILNAGLIPALEEGGFEVLPAARVSGMEMQELRKHTVKNIYVLNFADLWADRSISLDTTVTQVLADRPRHYHADGSPLPRVALFDQFEELFTHYPERWQDRKGFFEQLGEAMSADPSLRVLFAMREDFVAQIEPYEDLLPEELRTRYRLEQLREDAALASVQSPLEGTGIRFKAGVAESLVRDLLSETVGPGLRVLGEFIEPVQLQVVCFSLFRNLPAGTTEITEEHLAAFGDVDQALREFYQSALEEAANRAGIDEDQLRKWFETELITEAGTRGLVFRGEEQTGGIPNAAVDALEELHIIRSEVRGRDRWYELSHDRFVRPVLRANDAWRAEEKARREEENRRAIEHERQEAAKSRRQAQEQARLAKRFRRLFRGTVAIVVVAVALALAYWYQHQKVDRMSFESGLRTFDLAAEENLRTDPELSALFAWQAVERTRGLGGTLLLDAEDTLRRGLQLLTPEVSMGEADSGGENRAHNSRVSAVAFSPDGKRLATGSWDHTVRIWDVASGAPLGKPFSHDREVMGIAFNGEGTQLATITANGTVTVWEVESRQQSSKPFSVGSWPSGGVAFSPDARFLVTGNEGGVALVWNVQSGKAVSKLEGHRGKVTLAAFSADATFLATANDSSSPVSPRRRTDYSVIVWDGKTGKPRPPLFPGQGAVVGMSFSGDAKRLAIAGENGTVTVWDISAAKSTEPQYTLPSHGNRVSTLALSLDGNRIATAGTDARAKLWDVNSGEELPMRFPGKDYIVALAFSPDGQSLATTGVDGSVKVWDVSMKSAAEVVMTLPVSEAYAATFSHHQDLLATASNNGTEVWNVASGELRFPPFPEWGALNFNADDSELAIVSADGKVNVKNMAENVGALPPSCSIGGRAAWADFGRDWSEAIIADSDGIVNICRKSGVKSALTTSSEIGALSPDGKTIALGDLDGTLTLLDAGSLEHKCSWKTNIRQTDIIAFSYDGGSFATAGEHNTAQIWNSTCAGQGQLEPSKQLRSTLSGHKGAVTAIAFNRDGTRVATGSLDGTAKVWDVSSAERPRELFSFSHTTGVLSVDLSGDSKLLATVSADGYVRVYHLNIGIEDLARMAKRRVHRNLTAEECMTYAADGRCWRLVGAATP